MLLSDLKNFIGDFDRGGHNHLCISLRDKLFALGMPLHRARKTCTLVTVSSLDEKFIDELAGLLYDLSVKMVPELGEEAFFTVMDKLPTINAG